MEIVQLNLFDGKRCRVCKTWQPLSHFTKYKRSADRLSYDCRDCDRKRYLTWLHSDKAKNDERRRQSARTPKRRATARLYTDRFRDRRHAYYKKYYDKYRDKIREKKRSWMKAHRDTRRRWLERNRPRHASYTHKRKARMMSNGGTYDVTHWIEMCAWFGDRCLRCGASEVLTVDHVVPINLGGRNIIQNLQPLCLSCNCSKQDRIADYRPAGCLTAFLGAIGEPVSMLQLNKRTT
jgi:5-methylcytosine-specific restriction endonuclease McrA